MRKDRFKTMTDEEKWDDYHERYDEWEERKNEYSESFAVSDYATEEDLEEYRKRNPDDGADPYNPSYYLRDYVYRKHESEIMDDFYVNDPKPLDPDEEYEAGESDKADEARDD